MHDTLASRLRDRDADGFVGRAPELAVFDRLLGDEPSHSVVLLHGPGGIGKSTLLREVARRAAARGFEIVALDGREIAPVPGELDEALAPARSIARPLVLLDTWERISSAGAHLRSHVLPSLPGSAVVVLAGREPPDADWFQGGWERLALELPLAPMPAEDAAALVRSHHVERDEDVAAIVAWAGGSPLALALGADAAGADPSWRPARNADHPTIVRALIRRIAGTELAGGTAEAAAVAAIARRLDGRILADVLPHVDVDATLAWLRSLSFAEEMGGGVTLHDLARRALRAELRATEPDHERELRRRLADRLHARILAGETMLLVDLAELIDAPELRWGFGAEGSPDLRVDGLRDGDEELLEEVTRKRGSRDWWAATQRLLAGAPDRVLLVRDRRDTLCGFSICASPENPPHAAQADPVLGPWLEHAGLQASGAEALVWRDSVDLTASREGDPSSSVLSLLNMAAVLRSGLVNPRLLYLPIDPSNAPAVAFARGVGAVHVPELDVELGGKRQQCHVLDTGPGGVVGAMRATIYAELGLPAPEPVAPDPGGDADAVRAALRDLHRPSRLAANPLAVGMTPDERATSVRALVLEAVAGAFGASDDELLQRRVVERAYVDRSGTHEQAADELHLSRAAYFRRLRHASDRVAEWVMAHRRAS